MVTAKVVADSLASHGVRLTTMALRYPRFIHSEVMTHRAFSRNASSSRAIPLAKYRAEVRREPALPVFWGRNRKGMQATEPLVGWRLRAARFTWWLALQGACILHWALERLELHKQLANRILEPWSHITVIVTATDWENFYALRTDGGAQPEIRALAEAMLAAQNASTPVLAPYWHLPFVSVEEADRIGWDQAKRTSVARCARVSYNNHEGKPSTPAEDNRLYEQLVGKQPMHASPAEHQARESAFGPEGYHRNLRGWVSLRVLLPNDTIKYFPALIRHKRFGKSW